MARRSSGTFIHDAHPPVQKAIWLVLARAGGRCRRTLAHLVWGGWLAWVLLASPGVVFAQPHAPQGARQVEDLAVAFTEAIRGRDTEALLGLLSQDVVIKEHHAIIATGPVAVQAWVRACLAQVDIKETGFGITGPRISWRFADHSTCYWRYRPALGPPRPHLLPAEGTTELVVQEGQVVSINSVYAATWERRLWEDTAAASLAARAAALLAATPLPSASPELAGPVVPPATTQARTTPSVAPWATALVLMLTLPLVGLLKPRTHPDG